MKKEFQIQRLSLLFFGAFLFLLVVLGLQAIAVTDDYWLATYVLKRGQPFLSPFTWAIEQYLFWSGQIINHFLQGVFALRPLQTNFTSTVHALVFVTSTLVWALRFYKNFEEDRLNRLSFGALLMTGIFICSFSLLGESVFLAASTMVWSYSFFMLAYAIFTSDLFSKYHWLRYVVFFCAGNSADSLLIPLIILFMLNKKSERFPGWKKYFFIFSIGALLNILAPSTGAHLLSGLTNLPLNPADYLYRMEKISLKIVELGGWKIFLFIPLAFFFQVSSSMNPADLKKATLENLSYAVGSIFLFLFANGVVDSSFYFTFFIFFTLFIFWSLQLLKRKILQMRTPNWLHHLAILVGLLGCIEVLGTNYIDATRVRESFLFQLLQMDTQSENHKPVIVENHLLPMENHLLFYEDITKNKDDMSNLARKEYYEVESIIAK